MIEAEREKKNILKEQNQRGIYLNRKKSERNGLTPSSTYIRETKSKEKKKQKRGTHCEAVTSKE